MESIQLGKKTYQVDALGFLADFHEWDKGFAEGMAASAKIHEGLTPEHWKVLLSIREVFSETGQCPLVYETCRANGLFIRDLKRLFPAGYHRGACKLAGVTYRDRLVNFYGEANRDVSGAKAGQPGAEAEEKSYRVNVLGFLLDPSEWDEDFALCRAREMKMKGGLTAAHWKVIRYLRDEYEKTGAVPNLYAACEANRLELDDLE